MLGKRRRFWFFIGVAIMFLYFLITSNSNPNKPISRMDQKLEGTYFGEDPVRDE
ncbi:unknown protein [Paenibacillus amylolyticus]|uniref:Uncharacterized protein n=1 Tax=Paenibacillus amylolyticus TaxID=1451 RepID=A0A117I2B8_PAEAM|nr:unknown protein [Paenibacillus amylolyticus]